MTYTAACKARIDAARKAYDKLTPKQKKLVTNYKTLTNAEKKYDELKKGSPTEKKDGAEEDVGGAAAPPFCNCADRWLVCVVSDILSSVNTFSVPVL